jgi:predicted thioesterase
VRQRALAFAVREELATILLASMYNSTTVSATREVFMAELVAGVKGEASWLATERHSAETWGSGAVPVFSTPSLVGLMESAAMFAVAGRLGEGETTVGTRIEVSHLAATPLGDLVRAEATLVSVDGRRLAFDVVAHDSRQKVAEGRHERVIVSRGRFLAKLERR